MKSLSASWAVFKNVSRSDSCVIEAKPDGSSVVCCRSAWSPVASTHEQRLVLTLAILDAALANGIAQAARVLLGFGGHFGKRMTTTKATAAL